MPTAGHNINFQKPNETSCILTIQNNISSFYPIKIMKNSVIIKYLFIVINLPLQPHYHLSTGHVQYDLKFNSISINSQKRKHVKQIKQTADTKYHT